MPLIRFPTVKGLVYTIDLSKIADRENPRTVEAPIYNNTANTPFTVDWGDGTSTDFPAGASTFPSHEYAEGAGDVFTVVIRSASGNLPRLMFNRGQDASDTTNATYAVISLDHFGGITAGLTRLQYNYSCMYTFNMTYCDPRFAGQQNYADLYKCFQNSGISQAVESLCFDFIDGSGTYTFDSAFQNTKINGGIPGGLFRNNIYAVRFASCFYGCSYLTSIGEGLFDNNHALAHVSYLFNGCSGLQGAPYKFWGEDGTTDLTRFPDMTGIAYCYTGCSAALRAQVPESYGGTMTVG